MAKRSRPLASPPPEAWDGLLRLARLATRPLEHFLRIEAASGILLLVAAAVALIWANSPWADTYTRLWDTPLGLRLGPWAFERSLAWWVNDGLMAIFFFAVGLEIRREIHHGELSQWRRAALPAAAALGGAIVPAGLYLAIAGAEATRSGWGVPMATDIAFAVGILTLLGKRVPPALRVLLLAVAVIDDLGAIIVIALFYSSGVSLTGFAIAAGGLVAILLIQRLGVRSRAVYVAPALVVWAGVYAAGVHPTIAGVLVGLITPVRAWLGTEGFLASVRHDLEELASARVGASAHAVSSSLQQVDLARREALSPAESLIESLHPWVAFGIMPVFALANAGVALGGVSFDAASWTVVTGVTVGLMVGKPIGLLLACGLVLRLGIARLPAGLTTRHLLVLGTVAGVGFTMALFIAQLAFAEPMLLGAGKVGVLAASGGAAILALILGRVLLPTAPADGAARSADEAEDSTRS
ncbi:MAG: Na+/H+ antiporter NhaA [Myxococcales bacterium]|nr:Na+/H+ antiporter NhaA [Myxococcales bacterium]MCB9548567.1 Na+/H+ antiporter NhaA [Myxococcales bacterium]